MIWKEIGCKQLAVVFCNSIYMHRKMDSDSIYNV